MPFLTLERRGEFAVLRAVGSGTRHLLSGPLLEGSAAAPGNLAIGVPVWAWGAGRACPGPFFTLHPRLATIPVAGLAALAGLVVAFVAAALALCLERVSPARRHPGAAGA